MEAYDPFSCDVPSEPRGLGGFDVAPRKKRSRRFLSEGGREDDACVEEEERDDKEKERPVPGSGAIKPWSRGKDVAQLIGNVRPVANPTEKRMCSHYLMGDCMWGDNCRFSHNEDELKAGAPPTEDLDFRNLDAGHVSRKISVPRQQMRYLMSDSTRRLLTEASGVADITWETGSSQVSVSGTAMQTEAAEQLLKRVTSHCKWGISETKVHGLLSMRPRTVARLRLSPMSPSLKQVTFNLNANNVRITMGSDSSNDLTLKGPLISRNHVLLEFMPGKGALYVVDKSTNGTFLNGVRLPERATGKAVALFHGDELLFPEPGKAVTDLEFGFMVNIELT